MKSSMPFQLLFVLTVAFTGGVLIYNLVLRESYATVIHYAYPPVESRAESSKQPSPKAAQAPAFEPDREDANRIDDVIAPDEAADEEYDANGSVQFPLELNSATIEELKLIPRVGDVMAQRIVQYREHIGGYTDLEQLKQIKLVGEETYALLWQYLYIAKADKMEENAKDMDE